MKKHVRILYSVMKDIDYDVTIENDNSVNDEDFQTLYDIIREREGNNGDDNTICLIYDPNTNEAYYEE